MKDDRVTTTTEGEGEPFVQTMRIEDLLLAIPAMGQTKSDWVLMCLKLNPRDKLEGITMQQREALLAKLTECYPAAKIEAA